MSLGRVYDSPLIRPDQPLRLPDGVCPRGWARTLSHGHPPLRRVGSRQAGSAPTSPTSQVAQRTRKAPCRAPRTRPAHRRAPHGPGQGWGRGIPQVLASLRLPDLVSAPKTWDRQRRTVAKGMSASGQRATPGGGSCLLSQWPPSAALALAGPGGLFAAAAPAGRGTEMPEPSQSLCPCLGQPTTTLRLGERVSPADQEDQEV